MLLFSFLFLFFSFIVFSSLYLISVSTLPYPFAYEDHISIRPLPRPFHVRISLFLRFECERPSHGA